MSAKARKIELLAPAGSIDSLKAACVAGADAVYLAGKRFGARAFAANFDEKNLRWARRVTRSLNIKLYITLNTIVFENEWPILQDCLDFYETLQPDALIIQDIGVAQALKQRKSKIPLHLSTQGFFTGVASEDILKDLGISRVILPRELSLEEIKAVKANTTLELEAFVHGAMCYNVSGRCFWSIALGTRSGNRGTCAQPCRKEYSLNGQNFSTHFFSPKDLRLVDQLKSLVNTGLTSLKIEGRMKSAEYVFQVVSAYRKALTSVGLNNPEVLGEVYSREHSQGFALGIPAPHDWQTISSPGLEGVEVAKTTGNSAKGLTELIVTQQIKPGDGLFWLINSQKHGARITWAKPDQEKKQHLWVRGLPTDLPAGTRLNRSSNSAEGRWKKGWNRDWERCPIDLFWSGHHGTRLAVEARVNGHPLRLESDAVLQMATKKGLGEGPLHEKFAILGESFRAGKIIMTHLGEGLHIQASSLKRLKRQLVETIIKLEQLPPPVYISPLVKLIESVKQPVISDSENNGGIDNQSRVLARVWNQNFPFLRDIGADSWFLPLFTDNSRAKKIIQHEIGYWVPPVLNQDQLNNLYGKLESLPDSEILCSGWECFDLARRFPRHRFTIDWTFNLSNLAAIKYVCSHNIRATIAREWKEDNLPPDFNLIQAVAAWNPLVSMSRFPSAIPAGTFAQNSHRDRFFAINIGHDLSGLFLADIPASLPRKGNGPILLDIALGPKENPVQTAKDLNRLILNFKS